MAEGGEAPEHEYQQFAQAMTDAMANAFRNLRVNNTPIAKLSKFTGIVSKPGDLTLKEWLQDLDTYCRNFELEGQPKALAIIDHLRGPAREEILCLTQQERENPATVIATLRERFATRETLNSLSNQFNSRNQLEGESLADYSRTLIRLYDRMVKVAGDERREALLELRDTFLMQRFASGARDEHVRFELSKLELSHEDGSFADMRAEALRIFANQKDSGPRGKVRQVVTDRDSVAEHPIIKQLVENQKKMQEQLSIILSQTRSQNKSSSPRTCTFCNKTGHDFQNCFKRLNTSKCTFCKKVGHDFENCRFRNSQRMGPGNNPSQNYSARPTGPSRPGN